MDKEKETGINIGISDRAKKMLGEIVTEARIQNKVPSTTSNESLTDSILCELINNFIKRNMKL